MTRFLWILLMLTTVSSQTLQSRADEDPDDAPISAELEEDDEDFGPYVPVEWSLLWGISDHGRRITKATLVLRDKRTDDGYEDGTTIEFDTPELRAKLQSCFRMPPLRLATPDDGKRGMGWGAFNFGELRIETTENKFFIGLGWLGFHLNSRGAGGSTIFWQGKLARLISEVHFEKKKTKLELPNGLTLAESHVQNLMSFGDLRPEVSVPTDEKVRRAKEERRKNRQKATITK